MQKVFLDDAPDAAPVVGDVLFGGSRHTDLVLDKPTGQLLRWAVPLPLETPDEDSVVAGLAIQRAIHGLFLAQVMALVGGGWAKLGAGTSEGLLLEAIGNGGCGLR